MLKNKEMFLGLAITLALAGCGAAKNAEQALEEPGLVGSWEGVCSSSDLLGLSHRPYYRFAGAQQIEVHRFYQEKECVTPAAELRYEGEVKIGDEVQPQVRKLDLRFDSVKVTAITEDGRKALEKVSLCGVGAWVLGTPVDLSGKTGTLTCPLRKVPTGEFNIFSLEKDRLYLGKVGLSGGASVESDRPTTLERDNGFGPYSGTL